MTHPTLKLRLLLLIAGITITLAVLLAGASIDRAAAATGATDVSASSNQTCAIFAGKAWCWGENTYGQLGDGTKTDRSTPVKVAIPGDPVVTQISTGYWITCAVDSDGKVWCWGRGDYGALGNGQTGDNYTSTTPVQVAFPEPAPTLTRVTPGAWHACAIDSAGGLWCWGAGGNGRMGDGSSNDELVPIKSIDAGVTAISANNNHTCAIADGAVKCWGYGEGIGRLGTGDLLDRNVPTTVNHSALQSGALAVSAGRDHSCAVASNNQAYCWGDNGSEVWGCGYLVACGGQLGDGTWDMRTSPTPVSSMFGYGNSAAQIAAAQARHTCGIAVSSDIYCWGTDKVGQLGLGGPDQRVYPAIVPNSGGATVITAGEFHSCALIQGVVKCWGLNSRGQIGVGSTTNQFSPTIVLAPPNVAIDSPAGGSSTTDQQLSIQFSVSGNPALSCTVNGAPASSPFSADLEVGPNTITVVCTNSLGTASATTTVYRNAAPTVSISSPSDGTATTDPSTSVNFSTSGYPVADCTVNGVAGNSGSNVDLSPGSNTIVVACTNTVGTDSATVTVSLLTAPTVMISSPADGYETTESSASIEFSTSGFLPPTCKVEGVSATSPASVSLDPGENTINVECENATGTASASVMIKRNTVPVVSITVPLDGLVTTAENVDVGFTASGIPAPSCTVAGETAVPGHLPVALVVGANAIDVTCTSSAGSDTRTITVTRNTMPTAAITSPVDGLQTTDAEASISFATTGHPAPTCRINGVVAASPHVLPMTVGQNAVTLVCENVVGSAISSITMTRTRIPMPPSITSAPRSAKAGKSIRIRTSCESACRLSPALKIGKTMIKGIKSVRVRAAATSVTIKLRARIVARIRKALKENRRTKIMLKLSIDSADGVGRSRQIRIR